MQIQDYIIIALLIINLVLAIIFLFKKNSQQSNGELEKIEQIKSDMLSQQQMFRQEINQTVNASVSSLGNIITNNQKELFASQKEHFSEIDKHINEKNVAMQNSVTELMKNLENRFKTFSVENEQKLDAIRSTVQNNLTTIREDNNKQLEQMRQTVDEKLQKTLNERMTESFKMVNDNLEKVYKGLGDMQNLATGVGDLKKVLTNVKTRGILGEIQLGAILEQILAPEQYDTNVPTKKGSKNVVEYAIKLPTDNDETIYLPIDSKFPGDTYAALKDAYQDGTKEDIDEAVKVLLRTIQSEAKDIHDKYIDPPNTTEFAILFLPFEGLYAECVNRGMVEKLQQLYKVNIAGPSTMAALLNSLQMGFKTFAIQKRSGEVWKVLGAVKTEFDKFGDVLVATQTRLDQANKELDKLVGVRTRQIQRSLKNITSLSETQSEGILLLNDSIDNLED